MCTSHSSLVSGYITQYFGQLGFEGTGLRQIGRDFREYALSSRKSEGKVRVFYMPTLEVPFLN